MDERALQILGAINDRLGSIVEAVNGSLSGSIDPHHAYTRTQAARLLGVSVWTIDRARKDGLLIEARRIGQRDVRITGESLVEFLKNTEAASVRVRKL